MKRKILPILLCIFFLCIAGFYGFRFCKEQLEYHTGEKTYEELSQYIEVTAVTEESPVTEETKWPEVDFSSLQEINPEVTAWITIEGTNIHYPVVQGTDNSFYLNRLVNGEYNGAGSIFMDYRNQSDLSDRNTILYGHHMKNDTMFAQITNYREQSFYDQHPTGMLLTPERNYEIHFIAGYVIDMNSDAWQIQFASDDEFYTWITDSIALSDFHTALEPSRQDRVVTFSTCTYEYNDARYVLVGILK